MKSGLFLRLIDVVLLLLFGFISLASIRQEVVSPAETKEIDALLYRPSPTTIELRAGGVIYFEGKAISGDELSNLLSRGRYVVLLADRDAPAQQVMQLGRELARKGYEVSIMLHYRPGKEL